MIRLIVLYNLPPGSDEDEFLRWRLTDHQEENASMPGILRTDFARVDEAWAQKPGPQTGPAPYRFMTTVDWPDKESFEKSFYDPAYQVELQENLKKLANPVFLIAEILAEAKTVPSQGE
jgi:hypothetical protein